MKLTKETLKRIIKEELELSEQDGAQMQLNPIELEKEIESVVASYLGQNNDESYKMIESFVMSLMELKKGQKTRMEESTAAEEKERMAKIMASFSDEELAAMSAEKEAEEGRPAMGMPGVEEPMSPQERHRQYLLKKHSNKGMRR